MQDPPTRVSSTSLYETPSPDREPPASGSSRFAPDSREPSFHGAPAKAADQAHPYRAETGDVPAPAENLPDAARLHRIEHLLSEINSGIDLLAREGRHKDLSVPRIAAIAAQSLALLAGLWAASDLLFDVSGKFSWAMVKLGFAGLLQLVALTGFVISRER